MRFRKCILLSIVVMTVILMAVLAAACNRETVQKNNQSELISVTGGAVGENGAYFETPNTTDTLSMGSLVSVSEGATWQLCSDEDGQMPYATKDITQLQNGLNTFYIKVTAEDNSRSNVYKLEIYKNYYVTITYMYGQTVYQTEQALTHTVLGSGPAISKEGFTFSGWGCEGHFVIGPATFYASWLANTYMINLNPGEGEVSAAFAEISYDSVYQLPVPTREGYGFAGWYYGNTQMTDSSGYGISRWNIADDATLTAKWAANFYNVTANKNISAAGTVAGAGSKEYLSSVTLTASANAGYTWLGWYDGDTLLTAEEEYSFTMPMNDVAYTAKWASYGVTINKNISVAGGVSGNALRVTAGQQHTVEATTLTGYTWLGWYEDGELVSEERVYQFIMPAKNVVLVATWGHFSLAFSANISAAGWVGGDSGFISAGTSCNVSATTYSGYTWQGWYEGETLVSTDQTYSFLMPARNYILQATWGDYSITVIKNIPAAGSISGASGRTEAGTSCFNQASTVEGYTFLGWYEGNDLLSSEIRYEYTMPYRNFVLTACWEANIYQVILDANGGGALDPDTFDMTFGEDFSLPVPVLRYYAFAGWYYVNGSYTMQVTDSEGGCFSGWNIAENVTLTALWSADTMDEYIVDADDLKAISLTGSYALLNDIDLGGEEWEPIGDNYSPFSGTLEGNHHTISDFKITVNTSYCGLFGALTGTVSNLNLEDVIILQNMPENIFAGCLAGCFNGTIANCGAEGEMTISANTAGIYVYINAGGLVGKCESEGVIIDSRADVDIAAAIYQADRSYLRVGGLAGISGGELIDCNASGDIQSELYQRHYNYAGGLVGDNTGTIDGCHAEGDVSTNAPVSLSTAIEVYAGGICGDNGGVISDSYYDTGNVLAQGANATIYAGNIAGRSKASSTVLRCAAVSGIRAKMSNKNTSIISNVYVGGLIGYTAGTLENSYHAAGTVEGEINYSFGNLYAGGVCGYMNGGNIARCYSTGSVACTGSDLNTKEIYAGGFAGYNLAGLISDCYAKGNVSVNCSTTGSYNDAYAFAGGFSGYCNGNIICSYSTGTVSAVADSVMDTRSYAYSGGFAAYYFSGATGSCFATGNVYTETRIGSQAYAGGFTGREISVCNGYRCSSQSITSGPKGGIFSICGTETTLQNLQSEAYLTVTVGFGKYLSEEDRAVHPGNVWNFAPNQYPVLYWQLQ